MKVSPARAMVLLLFRPARFNELAAAYAKAGPPHPKWSFPETPTQRVRAKTAVSFLVMLTAVVPGWATGILCLKFYGAAPSILVQLAQYMGIGILLWATLAKGGWDIQTIKGESLPELVDRWIYRTLYCLGSYLLALSVSWPTAPASP